jgi:hypothetical protein
MSTMTRCENLKERAGDTVRPTIPEVPSRCRHPNDHIVTTLAGIYRFDSEQCLVVYCNIVG